MRRRYIENNDEQDPELIAKVLPYYAHTSPVLAGTQVAFVVHGVIFGLALAGTDRELYRLLLPLAGDEAVYLLWAVLALFTILAGAAYWIFTILIPGSHALVSALPILAGKVWVIRMNRCLYAPVVKLGLFLTRLILAREKVPFRNEVEFTYTEDEIRSIVEESHRSGRLTALENTLIKNSFDFFDLMVRDVMIPRNEMVVLELNEDLNEISRRIFKANHTCYPICVESKDEIVGFVHVKDFLRSLLCGQGQANLRKNMREILTVPETMPAASLLQLMKNRRTYMAVVADEYGGTVGMVALKDLIEELVGEIPEFLDQTPYEIQKKEDGSVEFDGTVILQDVSDTLSIDLDGENGETTIGGFVFSHLERLPEIGDFVDFSGWRFTVIRKAGFRIVRVKAARIGEEEAHAAEAEDK